MNLYRIYPEPSLESRSMVPMAVNQQKVKVSSRLNDGYVAFCEGVNSDRITPSGPVEGE